MTTDRLNQTEAGAGQLVPARRFSHVLIPELFVEDASPRGALLQLASRLEASLALVEDEFHRTPVQQALSEVKTWVAAAHEESPCRP